ncbi:MAG: hypothetical protein ACFFCV_17130 [Promethearchaeota archaeon]
MRKKIKVKSILLITAVVFLYSCSILTESVANSESITIMSWGCTSCSMEQNSYSVDWTYTGNITSVSIYYYDVSMTTIKYTIIENTPNNGTYEWNMPESHTLDGNYSLVVCDASNHNINDSKIQVVYPIEDITINIPIPGYPILVTGLIIGITGVIAAIILNKKLRLK